MTRIVSKLLRYAVCGMLLANVCSAWAASGPVAAYSFDEGSGSVANDSSGNGYTGTLVGSPNWVAGVSGTALNFNGSNYVQVANSPNVSGGSLTVSAWIYRQSGTEKKFISKWDDNTGNYQFDFQVYQDSKLWFQFQNGAHTGLIFRGTTVIAVNKWYHVAAVADAPSQTVSLFVNGIRETLQSADVWDGTIRNVTMEMNIGRKATGNDYWTGSIDDVRIYTRSLSAAEIAAIATPPPPVAAADSYGALINTTISIPAPGVLANDVDPAGIGLTAVLDSTVSHGVLALNSDGSFMYTPSMGFVGTDFFTYHDVNSNSQASSPVTVSLTIFTTLTVNAMSPAPNSIQNPSTTSILLTLNANVNASSVNTSSVKVTRAGPDGVLDTADDIPVTPSAINVVNGSQIKVDLPAQSNSTEKYRITLFGTTPSIPNMAAYFKFDEASGVAVADSTGNGNSATLTGTPDWEPGIIGGALNLNTSSYVTVDNASLGSFGANDFSVSLWMKSQSSNCVVVGNRRAQSHAAFWTWKIVPSGTVNFEVDQDGNGTNYNNTQSSTKKVNDGLWHHVAITRAGAVQKVYVDGTLDVSSTGPGTANVTNGSSVIVGANVFINEPSHYAGLVDDLRIFNRAITSTEVLTLVTHFPITDQNGFALDGEYPGTGGGFPSGDGTPGGDFTAAFQWNLLTSAVTTDTPNPVNYGTGSTALSAVVTSTQAVNSGTVTFQLKSGALNVGSAATSGTVTNGIASVSYTIPPGTAIGNYTVVATYSGAGPVSGNSDSSKQLTINKAPLGVVPNNFSRAYGSANPMLTGAIAGIQYGDNITATYSTAAVPASIVGDYAIVPTLVDPSGKLSNYLVTSNNGTLSVTAAPLSVTPTNFSRAYGAANPAFNGLITGIKNGDNLSATYATNASVLSAVGAYAIIPTLVDPTNKLSNYAVTLNNGTLTVTQAALTAVAFNATRTYGAPNAVFSGVLSGVLNGDNLLAVYTTSATPASSIGNYAITPVLVDPDGKQGNYSVTFSNGTLSVTKAILTVAAAKVSRPYGAADPTLGTITGIQNNDNITATFSTGATAASVIGDYPITSALADPDNKLFNYSVTQTAGTLTITPAALTVTADAGTKVYGTNNPVFTGMLTGVVPGDGVTATYLSIATRGTAAGTYDASKPEAIIPTLSDPNNKLGNYAVTPTNGTLTITPATASVTLGNLLQAYDGAPKAVSVLTAPPNLKVDVTYGGTATVPSNAGAYAVVAAVNDTNYAGITKGTLIIDRTTIISAAMATPNPALILQPVTLSVVGANSNSDNLTYSWSFGDGLPGSGASITHSYTAPGTFHAIVTIDNGLKPITDSVDVVVTAAVATIGEGPDSDGDGFSDSFEALAGTDAASPASTPTGRPTTSDTIGGLKISKAQIKLNFVKSAGGDSITFSGTLNVPQGFVPAGSVVLIDAGGILKKMMLGSKGSIKVGDDSFKVTLKTKNGAVLANPAAPFTATFSKGTFAKTLDAVSQLANGDFKSATRTVTFALVFEGAALKKQQTMSYTAKLNKSGLAK